jgi:hypothetical protein
MKIRLSKKRPKEVFLCHASKDYRVASKIAALIKEHGVNVWYSRTQLRGAQQWHDEIGNALKRCDWFLLLLSEAATRSKWVKHELIYALGHPQYENRILPVKYQACDTDQLSWTLESFQTVDLVRNFERGCRNILKSWGMSYRARKTVGNVKKTLSA